MCIRDRSTPTFFINGLAIVGAQPLSNFQQIIDKELAGEIPVSYTHLRAHETVLDLVCRLLLEKKKKYTYYNSLRPLR